MKKFVSKIIHGLFLASLAALIFVGSFFYERNFSSILASKNTNQIVLHTSASKVAVQKEGKGITMGDGSNVSQGDVINSGNSNDVVLNFGEDGRLRLDEQTNITVELLDNEKSQFVFKVQSGRVWLQNSYSNADVNLLVDGGVVLPSQSVVMVKVVGGKADVYVNQNSAVLALVDTGYVAKGVLTENSPEVVNKLFLPQGTIATVYADKVKENKSTLGKLLFSKLVKELAYSVFDQNALTTDDWLNSNVIEDKLLTSKIRDDRLKKIRTRGLKYSSLDASNYKIDQSLKDTFNALTFSNEKVGKRNLDALYDLLYDAQYLFDYGRKDEAQLRLDTFASQANQLFAVYGEKLKVPYVERVKREYEYLSFANPGDSLFGLKQVLEKIYLESIKGTAQELPTKFIFLTEKLSTLGFFANTEDFKNIKLTFEDYMTSFKDLSDHYQKEISANNTFVQRQNQAMDNLFMQFPALYRQDYFTNKLYVENKYLTLLPSSQDKLEESQSVVAQRIDFLNRLERFFLAGKVPLNDAQNILTLLFSEISKIQLPADYKVAVTGLFNERLQDYGVFSKFLSSPEYVSSSTKGATPQQRFDRFKLDNPQTAPTTQADIQPVQPVQPPVQQPPKTDVVLPKPGDIVIVDATSSPDQVTVKPKVPRVKPTK